jgi:DNA polymerase elongation subunit (family B)
VSTFKRHREGVLLFNVGDPNTYDYRMSGDFDLFDNDLRDDERNASNTISEASDFIVDIREYDVPYHVRVMIDLGI